jgi:hypothetical protein
MPMFADRWRHRHDEETQLPRHTDGVDITVLCEPVLGLSLGNGPLLMTRNDGGVWSTSAT